jgi:HAE1 family hydrophobic/amphiphilic exporter-1
MTITELAVKRPSFIVVIFLALGTLGVFGYFQLRYELLPKISIPVLTIQTVYPGASPSEVENSVSKPIEDAVSSLEKISGLYSNSYEGLSVIVIEFKRSADIDLEVQDAQRKVNSVLLSLPKDSRTPIIQKFSLDEAPVVRMGVTSTMQSREFYQFLKDQIQPAFSRIDGVGQVKLIGGDIREIKINLDAGKIKSYGLSIARVAQAVVASNLDFPTGAIKGEQTQTILRVAGKFASIDDLRNLVIARSRQGGDVRLRDVGEVVDGQQDMVTTSRIDGKTSVGIFVLKQSDANTVDVSKRVKEETGRLEARFASRGLKFDIAQDQSLFTLEAANAVKSDLMLAVLLVAIVMFFFLHSFRNSLIVMLAIPSSLVASVLAMWIFDFSLNLMTLLALSLVIGILVDDSIVVLENIHHFLERGENPRTAAVRGRNEIGFAALSITLVDVVVFVPLSVVAGLIGDIMREFAIVIVCSTLMSLFVSFTLTPMLASRFSRLEHSSKDTPLGRFALWFERTFKSLTEYYLSLLRYCLSKPVRILLAATLAFFGSLALPALGLIGNEFMKDSDRGEFAVALELPPGSTIENTNRVTQQVEGIISGIPEVAKMMSNVGTGAQGTTANNISEILVRLVPRDQRTRSTDDVAREIKEQTRQIPGSRVFVNRIAIWGETGQAQIQIRVTGNELDSINTTASRIAAALRQTPGVLDVKFSSEQGKPETRVEIDRQKMAAFGLTVYDVGTTLKVALTGDDDSKYREGSDEYTIRVALDRFDRSSPEAVGRLSFVNPLGQEVELKQFAEIYQATGPTRLERADRMSALMVSAHTDGRPTGTVVQDFQKLFGDRLAAGTSISFEGDEKNRSEGFESLMLAFIAGILFVYLIMVALYNSYIYPFVVLFSIPLAIVGALVALAASGNALSIFSLLGIIMLVGLVAKNAILLVDRTNENKAKGMKVVAALVEAGHSRLRPIMMTTLTMVFGMLPIALATGAGSEWKNGLAWALVGGLTSSMFLTLIVVPIVYAKLDRLRTTLPVLFRRPFALARLRRLKARTRERLVAQGGID